MQIRWRRWKESAGDPDKRKYQIKVKKVTVRVLNSL